MVASARLPGDFDPLHAKVRPQALGDWRGGGGGGVVAPEPG